MMVVITMELIDRAEVLSKKVYTETEEGWSGYTVDVKYIEQLSTIQAVPIEVLYELQEEISKLQSGWYWYPVSEYGNRVMPFDKGTLFYVNKLIDDKIKEYANG